MATITFDTQELVMQLESSGFARQQSDTVVSVLKKAQSELSTKRDIEDLRLSTKQEIDELRHDMDARLIQLEQRLTIKLGSMMVVAIGIVAVLVKLL